MHPHSTPHYYGNNRRVQTLSRVDRDARGDKRPRNHEGIHWFVCFRNNQDFEVFDSLGTSLEEISGYFQLSGDGEILCNNTCLQPLDSVLCGQYCIYYIGGHNIEY